MTKINDFKTSFSDFLRPNLYAVYFFPKKNFFQQDKNQIGMLSHETTFPFMTFTTNSFWYNNKETFFVNKIDYDPASFNFYVDRDNIILGFFDAWIKQIIDSEHRLGYYDDYVSTIEVELFDRQMKTSAIATIIDAYPVNITSMDLAYAQNDAILNLNVSFQFRDIEYNFVKAGAQQKDQTAKKVKSWKDFLTLGNLRRGVNTLSKIKNYRRMIENGSTYDIVTNARKIF